MRDLTTDSSCSDIFLNFNDLYLDIDGEMLNNPRKLGRGSRRLGSRGWRLQGNMHGAGDAARMHCKKIALDVNSARMDRDWVQNAADSCHRLQGTSGELCEHISRWLPHH